MRICVIGNSHVAALKKAAAIINLDNLDFYAIPGAGAPDLLIKEGRLFPDYTSNKGVTYPSFKQGEWVLSNIPNVERDGLKLSNYDCILYSGIGLPALRSSNINTLNQVVCCYYSGYNIASSLPFVSKYCFEKLMQKELQTNASINSLKLIMQHFKGQILLQHFPSPSEGIVAQDDFLYKESLTVSELITWYYSEQIKYINQLIANSKNAEYLFNNFELTDQNGFSDGIFALPSDGWHLNQSYGVEVLLRLKNHLEL